jgi:Tfp pilus assembly PilM family ATPase
MSKVIGIEINDEIIKIVEGTRKFNKRNITVIKCITLCPSDGKILNTNLVKNMIEEALILNNIKTKIAVFVINTNSVMIRKMKLPVLKRKADTLSMIKIELEQLSSTNFNQNIIYKKSNNISADNMADYLIYGLSYDLYNQYIELSQKLKLKLVAIEISSNVLEKIPAINLKINNDNYLNNINAFVNINYNSIKFSVLNNGINDFFNSINFNKNISSDKEKNLNFIIDEIFKQIRYYYYTIGNDIVFDKIYFYGDCSRIVGNERYLTEIFNIDVEVVKSISNAEIFESYDDLNIQGYLNCILSLFISSKNVNFLTEKNNSDRFKFIIGIVIMTMSLFFLFKIFEDIHNYTFNNRLTNQQLITMKSFINNEENIKLHIEIEDIKNNIIKLEKYIENANILYKITGEENSINAGKIDSIMNAKPEETKILFISADNSYINIQCKSHNIEDMMLFIKELREVEFISHIYVPDVFLKQEENPVYSYSVICDIGD